MTLALAATAPHAAALTSWTATSTTGAGTGEMGGLTGAVLDIVDALGAVGVGVLTLAENLFPPLPSEVILPLAGYLAERGRMSLAAILLAATIGSLVGAWVFYGLGAQLGRERSALLLARLPLVDREDVDGAFAWFDRHGRWAVLVGRLVPGVRSLVSLPAGASLMPLARFSVLTAIGSCAWNAVLIGAGYALGTRWHTVEEYANILDAIFITAATGLFVVFVVRQVRKRRDRRTASAEPAVEPAAEPAAEAAGPDALTGTGSASRPQES